MAYLESLKDGRTRAHVERQGVRKSRIFDTQRQAKDWAKRLEIELAEQDPRAFTFAEMAQKYLDSVTANKPSKVQETRRIQHFMEHFGNALLSEIDTPQVAEWRDLRLKTVSGSSVVREANILRNIFNVAKDEWRWIDRNPFTGLKLPKENKPRKAIWSWQLIKRVLRAKREGKTKECIDAFHIALRTGMRLQEVLSAPQNFDAKRQVVTVKTKTEQTGEEIPIGRIAAKLLKRKPFQVEPNEASVLFSKLCRQLMITGLTFHDARATGLTMLARKVDVLRLAKISRHKDISLLSRVYYRERTEDISRLI